MKKKKKKTKRKKKKNKKKKKKMKQKTKKKKKKKKKKKIAACFKAESLSRFGHVQNVPYKNQLRRYFIANL